MYVSVVNPQWSTVGWGGMGTPYNGLYEKAPTDHFSYMKGSGFYLLMYTKG